MKIYVAASALLTMLISAQTSAYYSDGYQAYGVDDLSQAIGKIYAYNEDGYVQQTYQDITSRLEKYGNLVGCNVTMEYNNTNEPEIKPRVPPEDIFSFLLFASECERAMDSEGVWYWNNVAQQRFGVTTDQFFKDHFFVRGSGCLAQDILVFRNSPYPSYMIEMMRVC